MEIEYKDFRIETKEIDGRTVKGITAVFGNIDDGGDRIHRGSFRKTIQESMPNVQHLWQHRADEPPTAAVKELKEVGRDELPEEVRTKYPEATGGLYVAREYLETERGNEILTGIRADAITKMSIGFNAIKFDFEELQTAEQKGRVIRNLRENRLYDTSDVNWGMNSATVSNFKSLFSGGADSLLTAGTILENVLKTHWQEYEFRNIFEGVALDEVKAGRVLSARNLSKLKDALAVLEEILLVAEPPPDEIMEMALTPDFLKAKLFQRLEIASRELAMLGV